MNLMRTYLVALAHTLAAVAIGQCPGVLPGFSWQSVGSSILFTDISTGMVDQVTWNMGDGMVLYGPQVEHTYATAGVHVVTLTVYSAACQFPVPITLVHGGVADACDHTIVCGSVITPTMNNVLQFADASDGAGNPLVHLWQFGDGAAALAEDTSHFYPIPGMYDVAHSIGILDTAVGGACTAGRVERIRVDGNASTCDTSLFVDALVTPFAGGVQCEATVVPLADSLSILSTTWSYGDDSQYITSDPTAQYMYPYPGEYQICLTVWAYDEQADDSCFAMNCRSVSVVPVTAIEEQVSEAVITAWPIPFNERLILNGPVVRRGAAWRLFSMHGALVAAGRCAQDGPVTITPGATIDGVYTLVIDGPAGHAALRVLRGQATAP
jgi:PKD repeat protein